MCYQMFQTISLPFLKQTWAMVSVLLFNVSCGMMVDVVDPVSLPMKAVLLVSKESTRPHIFTLGLLSSAVLMHRCGRRPAFITATFTGIMCWVTNYFATSPLALTMGRNFAVFSNGAGVILGAIIVGEYTSPMYRRFFLILASSALAFGRGAAYFLGNGRNIALFALASNMLSYMIACTWPESPAWLASRQRYDDCRASLFWLRGKEIHGEQELTKLMLVQEEDASIKIKSGIFEMSREVFRKFTAGKFIKPIVVLTFASILAEASGKHVFEAYGNQIMYKLFGISPAVDYTLTINVIATGSIMLASILAKILNRSILFISGFASVFVLFLISLNLFIIAHKVMSINPWIITTLLIGYLVLINLSCTVIFLIWCGELFPFAYKSAGLVISGLVLSLNRSMFLSISPYLITGLKLYGTFGILTAALTTVLLILYFIAPDTKNRCLLDLEIWFDEGDRNIGNDNEYD